MKAVKLVGPKNLELMNAPASAKPGKAHCLHQPDPILRASLDLLSLVIAQDRR